LEIHHDPMMTVDPFGETANATANATEGSNKFFKRIVGSDALGEAINYLVGQNTDEPANYSDLVLVFDMDKTLTNAKDETHVRGGNNTIEALRNAKSKGAQMFIVSAASPTKIAVDSAVGQLSTGTYCILKDIFEMKINSGITVKYNGIELAKNGSVYMSGYNKEEAIDHIIQNLIPLTEGKKHRFAFFDDAVGNAFNVGSYFQKNNLIATSFWWDPFEEDCFLADSMPEFDPTKKYKEYRSAEWDNKIECLQYNPPTHKNLTSTDFSYGMTRDSLNKKRELSAFEVDADVGRKRGECYRHVATYRWGVFDPKKAEEDADAKKKERLSVPDHSKNTRTAKSFLMKNLKIRPPSGHP